MRITSLLAALLTMSTAVNAIEFNMPEGSETINVTDPAFGAIPDDGKDDTDAIQQAIHTALKPNSRYWSPKIIYFPKGVYNISKTLYGKSTLKPKSWSQGYAAGMILMGESRENTIIQLKDSAKGFNSAKKPKAIIKTGSENPNKMGGGNEAFRHSILNLTINTGNKNPGVIGIDYAVSNRGSIRHVNIHSGDGSGSAGIALNRREQGPGLIQYVDIKGFNKAVVASYWDFSMTLEHITISGQTEVGIHSKGQPLHIRGLISKNSCMAYKQEGGLAMLIDSEISYTGDNGDKQTAIMLAPQRSQGMLRNVKVTGYGTAINSQAGDKKSVKGDTGTIVINEYVSRPIFSAQASAKSSLNLPVEETPDFNPPSAKAWVSTSTFSKDSKTAGIQEAIDSGAHYIFLPNGNHFISQDIIIRGPVKKIMGMQSIIRPAEGSTATVRFAGKEGTSTILEHLFVISDLIHEGAGTLTLRHMDVHKPHTIRSTETSTGKLFIEDVIGFLRLKGKTKAWGRQFNTENKKTFNISVGPDNSLWILGLKHEANQVLIDNQGGDVEILGGYIYCYNKQSRDRPLFINNNGRMSLTVSGHAGYPVFLKDTRNGKTTILEKKAMTTKNSQRIPLVTAY